MTTVTVNKTTVPTKAQGHSRPSLPVGKRPPLLDDLAFVPETISKYAGVYEITPEASQYWLEHSKTKNRPISKHEVLGISQVHERGEWMVNGETLVFNEDGDINNGHHRLHACVKSGKPFWTWVIHSGGVQANCFTTYDSGKTRTNRDVLAIAGFSYYAELSGALNYVDKYYAGFPVGMNRNTTGTSILQLAHDHPEMEKSCEWFGHEFHDLEMRLLSFPAGIAMHYLSGKFKPEMEKFLRDLYTGANLDEGNPILRLRNRLIENRSRKAKITSRHIFALAIKTWNAVAMGKSMGHLAWKDNENFPEMVGAPPREKVAQDTEVA